MKRLPTTNGWKPLFYNWRGRVGIEPTKDSITAPLTVLKFISCQSSLYFHVRTSLLNRAFSAFPSVPPCAKSTQYFCILVPALVPKIPCSLRDKTESPPAALIYSSIRMPIIAPFGLPSFPQFATMDMAESNRKEGP